MTEERLKMINKIAEKMKSIAKIKEKMEEGHYRYEIRLSSMQTMDGFGVYPFLSEAQRSEIEDLVEKYIRKNLEDYRKEFEEL